MSKTTTLHVHHAFCIFLCRPCPTTTWNDQILSWLENGNGKAINFAFSLWIRTWSPLFSSNLTSLLSSDWVTWHKGEKVVKLLSCVPVLNKTWIQALSRCSRAMAAKKCTKKAWCTWKVVVLLIKPVAFLPFSLPSASSLLKLPNDSGRRLSQFNLG